jgi:hypothetical protein
VLQLQSACAAVTRKRIVICSSVVAAIMLCLRAGYLLSRDTVHVTDAVSSLPVGDAQVVPIYPSFSGSVYTTDRRGIARIGGLGSPRGGYGVQVSAAGYHTNFLGTYPTSGNHSGLRGDRVDISLQPLTKSDR